MFDNPYKGEAHTTRLTTDVSTSDYMLVKTTRVATATITTTINLLWSKLCNELRQRGIDDYTKCAEYESFLSGIHLVPDDEYQYFLGLRDGASGRLAGEAAGPIYGPGTPRPRSESPAEENLAPVVESRGRSRVKRAKAQDIVDA